MEQAGARVSATAKSAGNPSRTIDKTSTRTPLSKSVIHIL
jgi:hypothetical protein